MADDPEAVRLARNWRANTPPDRSPAYIADDLARSVLSQHDENTRLRAALAEALNGWESVDQSEQACSSNGYRGQCWERIAEMRREWKL